MAEIAGVLGEFGISIASVLQREAIEGDSFIPLIIMTHQTTEGAAQEAVAKIETLQSVRQPSVRMWVRN